MPPWTNANEPKTSYTKDLKNFTFIKDPGDDFKKLERSLYYGSANFKQPMEI
jgi:hypothetical protein